MDLVNENAWALRMSLTESADNVGSVRVPVVGPIDGVLLGELVGIDTGDLRDGLDDLDLADVRELLQERPRSLRPLDGVAGTVGGLDDGRGLP
jgi:hypothetical protein